MPAKFRLRCLLFALGDALDGLVQPRRLHWRWYRAPRVCAPWWRAVAAGLRQVLTPHPEGAPHDRLR